MKSPSGDLPGLLLHPIAAFLAVVWALRVSGILRWLIFALLALRLLLLIDQRVSRSTHDWFRSDDVAVVTGGSRGLGRAVAEQLSHHVGSVAVLDIAEPEEPFGPKLEYFRCDVADGSALQETLEAIRARHGTINIVVNNAGVRHRKPLLEMSESDIISAVSVNFLSSVRIIRHYLPFMEEAQRGYIVNVASALAFATPARLAVYGATKAALVALHEALRAEISQQAIRMLLVVPGQLDTAMFADVETPSPVLAPVVAHEKLAEEIVAEMTRGGTGWLCKPFYVRLLPLLRAVPEICGRAARQWSGMDAAAEGANGGEKEG